MAGQELSLGMRFLHWLITKSGRVFSIQQRLFARDYRDVVAAMKPMLPPPGSRVLDVGCGTAHCAEVLLGRDRYQYTGMDNNPAYITGNKKRWPEATFVLAERLEEDVFQENAYDCALVSSLLHHINDEAVGDLVRQLRRVLVPGGIVLVTDPLFWQGPGLSFKQRASNMLLRWDRGRHIRTIEGYKALLPDLTIEQETEYVYTIHRFWAVKYQTPEH